MSRNHLIHVLGAGGHAKVIIRAAILQGYRPIAVFDDDIAKHGDTMVGIPIIGSIDDIESHSRHPTIIAIGDNATRKAIAEKLNMDWISIIHPGAIVDESVKLGRGSMVMAGAVIQVDTTIGENSIVNTGATVDHDCALGRFTHIGPGANVAGQCSIGEGVLLGIGSAAIPSIKVGDWATVGAGAVVVNDIKAKQVALGIPAKVHRGG